MSHSGKKSYEENATNAFDRQSVVFDKIYTDNLIIQYKRDRVRAHVQEWISPHSHILELNAGTGEDAAWFAAQGHTVHATDISEGMQARLREKMSIFKLGDRVTTERCSFNDLERLEHRGPYDLIFSNFAGLNCTNRLSEVLASLAPLLKPGGRVTLVMLPSFCLWETALMFRGKFKTAFRRFFSSKGREAHIEGEYFRCWYYNPSFIQKELAGQFTTIGLEGLCTIVPPSYVEGFAEKHPGSFRQLKKLESKWKTRWPWATIGDYFIISLKKNDH